MNIVLVEDNAREARFLEGLINTYCQNNQIESTVTIFYTEKEARAAFKPGLFDIIFVDIFLEEEGAHGFDLSRDLTEQDKNLKLVFCTNSRDHGIKSYSMNTTHYIVKPITKENVGEALAKLSAVMERDARFITVNTAYSKANILLKNILYAEVYKNYSVIHTTAEAVKVKLPLGELEQMLKAANEGFADCFVRCHRSHLVNMNHVKEVRDDHEGVGYFIMTDGSRVAVRQSGGKTAKRLKHDFVMSKIRSDENA